MNANKVTNDLFKKAGFLFSVGDVISSEWCESLTVRDLCTVVWNDETDSDEKWRIESLAPRKNTGTQPVTDDCVVEITGNNGNVSVELAINVPWFKTVDKSQNGAVYAVVSWIPHLPSIFEKQRNIDKSALELTERDIENAFIQQDDAAVYRELAESDAITLNFRPEIAARDKLIDLGFTYVDGSWLDANDLEAKEREDAAIDLHDYANDVFFWGDTPPYAVWGLATDDVKKMWLAVVDKTEYRK